MPPLHVKTFVYDPKNRSIKCIHRDDPDDYIMVENGRQEQFFCSNYFLYPMSRDILLRIQKQIIFLSKYGKKYEEIVEEKKFRCRMVFEIPDPSDPNTIRPEATLIH